MEAYLESVIHLAVSVSPYFGYGVCGTHLLNEFSKTHRVYLDCIGENLPWCNQYDALIENTKRGDCVDAPLLQFPGEDFAPQVKYRGKPNAVYIFSEWEPITERQKENLRRYDVLIAGSEWNAQVIRNAGFECAAVQQGVDQSVFHPQERVYHKDNFVIFSGGKFEHRKGQDLVIEAFNIFSKRHLDAFLVTSWFNIWGNAELPAINESTRVLHLGLTDHKNICRSMNQTDVGIFPNRCEGGTNLVMMEYLSCGKPVIANFGTGQKDVLDKSYALEATTVDEIVDQLEILYRGRNGFKRMGTAAHEAMKNWTWAKTADGILGAMA